ncbi:UNVERIFIED_CONTAM: hypothetical protein Slati_1363100 [Sesamum latifolium]|uniref:Uncharacterized protein n=1 Tax=Sesamum latifolium TaxID=2727402 RepID=A0AAW2XI81_9LAMI
MNLVWGKVIVPPGRMACLKGRILGTGLRNLAGGRIRCPPKAGLRCLCGEGLRCLHGTKFTSLLEKDLSAYPNEGLCTCVEDRVYI